MSILHYRLVKSTNINSSWNFDTHYIHRIITSSNESTIPKNLLDIYLDDNLVLYDNNEEISFRDEKYRCCMENTLLQFLKVLFWDGDNKTYNLANITEIISDNFQRKIDEFFRRKSLIDTNKKNTGWMLRTASGSVEDLFYQRDSLSPEKKLFDYSVLPIYFTTRLDGKRPYVGGEYGIIGVLDSSVVQKGTIFVICFGSGSVPGL